MSFGEGRIDIAAINGSLVGFEIKSASDGLARLSKQIDIYNRVVDEAFLVVDRRHPFRLLERLPPWWGLWAASSVAGECRLHELRPSSTNPEAQPLATAQLLWRDEALSLLREHGHGRGLSKANRWQLWTTVAAVVPFPVLREHVRATLRARPGW